MKNILVVDDDERLCRLIVELLKFNKYSAEAATSAAEARALLLKKHYDAMIVDWMMPYETGIDFVKSIRASSSHLKNIPAIMLTAMDDINNKLTGFDAGFDDYITKPFDDSELIARLKALLKRTAVRPQQKILKFGLCTFDVEKETLYMSDKPVYLSTTELTLLKTLCQRPNQPFSRDELSKKLSFQVSDRTIDVQITRLRKKIGDDTKKPNIIKTVRYIGYSISCQ